MPDQADPRPSPAAARTLPVPAQLLVTALIPALTAALLVTQADAGGREHDYQA